MSTSLTKIETFISKLIGRAYLSRLDAELKLSICFQMHTVRFRSISRVALSEEGGLGVLLWTKTG